MRRPETCQMRVCGRVICGSSHSVCQPIPGKNRETERAATTDPTSSVTYMASQPITSLSPSSTHSSTTHRQLVVFGIRRMASYNHRTMICFRYLGWCYRIYPPSTNTLSMVDIQLGRQVTGTLFSLIVPLVCIIS